MTALVVLRALAAGQADPGHVDTARHLPTLRELGLLDDDLDVTVLGRDVLAHIDDGRRPSACMDGARLEKAARWLALEPAEQTRQTAETVATFRALRRRLVPSGG